MRDDVWGQSGFDVRFEWGPAGAERTGRGATMVLVDVLSFTTSVSVLAERGMAVYPARWGDAGAEVLARDVDAVMAVGRSQVSADQPWSLSPAGLRAAPATAGLVLPSPNGSAIASVSSGPVVAACLRNAAAVARWVAEHAPRRPVTVIAAGERWPDGSLRPALEDLLGAGAVLHEMSRLGFGSESPEAVAARLTYSGTSSVADAVRCCGSGLELIDRGFAADVEVAVEIDSAVTVPVLSDRAFRAA